MGLDGRFGNGRDDERGDFIVQLGVHIPRSLNEEQRTLLERLEVLSQNEVPETITMTELTKPAKRGLRTLLRRK